METEWNDGQLGTDKFLKLTAPRFMKTHLPFELWKSQLEKHPNLKVIQTLRNPKDNVGLVLSSHEKRNPARRLQWNMGSVFRSVQGEEASMGRLLRTQC